MYTLLYYILCNDRLQHNIILLHINESVNWIFSFTAIKMNLQNKAK